LRLARHIQHWDDERNLDNGIIVTLNRGFSFEPFEHLGVKGFDTAVEAKEETKLKNVYRCDCPTCKVAREERANGR